MVCSDLVTTPHGRLKPGASQRRPLKAPSEPRSFGCIHFGECDLKTTEVSNGTQNAGTLVLLLTGTIYCETPKYYSNVLCATNCT